MELNIETCIFSSYFYNFLKIHYLMTFLNSERNLAGILSLQVQPVIGVICENKSATYYFNQFYALIFDTWISVNQNQFSK